MGEEAEHHFFFHSSNWFWYRSDLKCRMNLLKIYCALVSMDIYFISSESSTKNVSFVLVEWRRSIEMNWREAMRSQLDLHERKGGKNNNSVQYMLASKICLSFHCFVCVISTMFFSDLFKSAWIVIVTVMNILSICLLYCCLLNWVYVCVFHFVWSCLCVVIIFFFWYMNIRTLNKLL